MPFKSEKQRKFMWAKHPKIARKWAREEGGNPVPYSEKKKKEVRKLSKTLRMPDKVDMFTEERKRQKKKEEDEE